MSPTEPGRPLLTVVDDAGETGIMGRVPAPAPSSGFRGRRVKKAYEQVFESIQHEIFSGALERGDRLPSEAALAVDFGVSRATVREALRLLTSRNLIRTDKGAAGGSFVTLPSVTHVSETLNSSISLLTVSRDITLDEFLEAREILEVPAARMAAERRDEAAMEHVHGSIPGHPLNLNTDEQFTYNRDFHSAIVEAAGNTLVIISAQPIFSVLQTNLARSTLGDAFHRAINGHHIEIADAITRGDGDAAAQLMYDHLTYLRPFYEKAWKHAKKELDR